LETAKKNLVFYFGVGRHASFPQKPVVKASLYIEIAFAKIIYLSEAGVQCHRRMVGILSQIQVRGSSQLFFDN
jgi:hypothetical protein